MSSKEKQEIINNKLRAIFKTIETHPEEWKCSTDFDWCNITYTYQKGDIKINFSSFGERNSIYIYLNDYRVSSEGLSKEFKVFHDKYNDFLHCQRLKRDIETLEKAGM